MKQRTLRWGILGTANIARKNWHALKLSGNSQLTAVASREVARSRQFIDECQAEVPWETRPEALGSYEALLSSTNVDAVYIPLPTAIRKEWVLKAAAAGKHVMCEKPCGSTATEVREMVEACRRHRVQFMDGVMFMHSARLAKIREILSDGVTIGDIRRITTNFSFASDSEFLRSNIRMHSGLEPHGCLGDLGWYCLRFILWAMNGESPKAVSGRILSQSKRPDSPAPVPTQFSGELLFDKGVSASFYCSFLTENEQWVQVSGSKGGLRISDFVLPFFGSAAGFEVNAPRFEVNGCHFNMASQLRRIQIDEYSNNHTSAQEVNLFRTFSELALSGKPDEDWPGIALRTQDVMEACLADARMQAAQNL